MAKKTKKAPVKKKAAETKKAPVKKAVMTMSEKIAYYKSRGQM